MREGRDLTRAIERGLDSVVREQTESGEFPVFWSEKMDMSDAHRMHSPFVAGMILSALKGMRQHSVAARIFDHGRARLLSHDPRTGSLASSMASRSILMTRRC